MGKNVGNGPNTVSDSTASNTKLSEFFGAHWVPGSELSEFFSAYYLCANANSPSFFPRTHRVCPKTHCEAQWVLSSKTVLSKQYSARFLKIPFFTPPGGFPCLFPKQQGKEGQGSFSKERGKKAGQEVQFSRMPPWKGSNPRTLTLRPDSWGTTRPPPTWHERFALVSSSPASSDPLKWPFSGI